MNRTAISVLVGIAGIIAIIFGVQQMLGSDGVPTQAEAAKSARSAIESLTPWTNQSRGISLQYPKDWSIEEPTTGPLLLKFKTFQGVVNVNLASEEVPEGTMLFEYVNRNVDEVMTSMTEQKMSPQRIGEEKLVIGGFPASKVMMAYKTVEPALDVQVTQAYVVNGKRAYAITLTTPKDLHAEYEGLFGKILESIRLS